MPFITEICQLQTLEATSPATAEPLDPIDIPTKPFFRVGHPPLMVYTEHRDAAAYHA